MRGITAARQRGAVVVEFALVCLMLLVLLAGPTEFGRAWFTVHMLSSAAREGARVGAVTGGGAGWEAAIRARIGAVLEPAGIEAEITVWPRRGWGQPITVVVATDFRSVAQRLVPGLDRPLRLKGSAVFNQELP
jgi:hypothetical protein